MKKIVLIVGLIMSLPLMAQQEINRSLVNVTGEGIVKIVPDEVIIKSRVEHEGDDANTVKKQNDDTVNKVIKYLKGAGVEEKNIKTDYVNLNKRYNYNDKTYSYVTNQAISITLKDIDNYEKIMKGLFENGLNRINGVEFKSSEMEKYEKQARKKAVLDAQNRAQELAEPLGQKIGKAVTINEMDYSNNQPVYRMMKQSAEMSSGDNNQETIAPGEMEVSIKVNVAFELK